MNTPEHQLLMVGQAETGKTTFLALLWLAILWNREPGLELADYQDDRSYLQHIAARLQSCDPALHTELGEDRDLKLSLLLGDEKEPAVLRVPDLSGETWRDATVDRHWPESVEEQIHQSRGLLMFLHSRDMDAGATIGDVAQLLESLSEVPEDQSGSAASEEDSEATNAEVNADGQAGDQAGGARRKYEPPTQVTLVDALQLVCQQRGPRKWRTSIVISAWDLVESGVTPLEFVAENLPLLAQYLEANEDWLEVRVFGLSAQGGDFGNPSTREELAQADVVDRASVRDGAGASVNLGEIVAWLLGQM